MSASGGIIYHLRALRFQKNLWERHSEQVSKFLESWNPTSKGLTLVGASAGYSIPDSFLKRFDRITAYEPDLIARAIFEKTHTVKIDWKKKWDFQVYDGAILFCNLLGQIPILNEKEFKKKMNVYVLGREFASFHDVLSGHELEFDTEDAPPKKVRLSQMKQWVYPKNPRKKELEVNAHQTIDLFEEEASRKFQYWQWTITPKQSQLIEGVYQKV